MKILQGKSFASVIVPLLILIIMTYIVGNMQPQ